MAQTFEAKDIKEALAILRAALGADAVILASEKTRNGVRVSAAPADEQNETAIVSFEARYRDRLFARLREARDTGTADHHASFSRPELLQQLHAHRVPEPLAHALAEAAEQSGYGGPALALASALDKRMTLAPLTLRQENAILIIGPNGAGKTAIAAKLAAEAKLLNRTVRLAATDSKSAGQRERLETFAVHLGIPVSDASSPKLLSEAAAKAREENALLIADTAGIDPRNPLPDVVALAGEKNFETAGVVSACIDAEEAGEIAGHLAALGAKRLIVTGLDLARRKGAVAALAAAPIALAHVTASPYLGEGLDCLTPPALARALLAPL